MHKLRFVLALGVGLGLLLLPGRARAERRVAVVVGANAAPVARSELHFAHRDAEQLAEVLTEVGRFKPDDVHLLLDPDPAQVLTALDGALADLAKEKEETMLVFYYSGHADAESLYPNGKPLAVNELIRLLDSPRATVRVGIIDACRGGSWTQAKGLTPAASFEVRVPFHIASEGTVLLASSSGLENSHETEALKGSFFTHHLIAGLRGAAEQHPGGEVTVQSAFNYANEMTIRDTAAVAETPQHPSFDMKLHGRRDLVLAQVQNSPSVLDVEEQTGPLQLVQLSSGVVVLELPEGQRDVHLAVPPGKYLLRKHSAQGMYVREIDVESQASQSVGEGSLQLVGNDALLSKDATLIQPVELKPSKHMFALGVDYSLNSVFFEDVSIELTYRYRLSSLFSVQPVHFNYTFVLDTGLKQELETEFGVQPTSFNKQLGLISADLVFTPFSMAGSSRWLYSFSANAQIGPALQALESINPFFFGTNGSSLAVGGHVAAEMEGQFSQRFGVKLTVNSYLLDHSKNVSLWWTLALAPTVHF
jgi:hypothetical protein